MSNYYYYFDRLTHLMYGYEKILLDGDGKFHIELSPCATTYVKESEAANVSVSSLDHHE